MLSENIWHFASKLHYTSLLVLEKLLQQSLRVGLGKISCGCLSLCHSLGIFLRLGVCLLALGQLPEETND